MLDSPLANGRIGPRHGLRAWVGTLLMAGLLCTVAFELAARARLGELASGLLALGICALGLRLWHGAALWTGWLVLPWVLLVGDVMLMGRWAAAPLFAQALLRPSVNGLAIPYELGLSWMFAAFVMGLALGLVVSPRWRPPGALLLGTAAAAACTRTLMPWLDPDQLGRLPDEQLDQGWVFPLAVLLAVWIGTRIGALARAEGDQ